MYKIIQNDKIIDVVETPKFLRFLSSGHVVITDKSSAHGIKSSDDTIIYSLSKEKSVKYPLVSIKKINEEEFKRLQNLLNSGSKVSSDTSALATAKQAKIASLSNICKASITKGFNVQLTNGEVQNFKLTTEDQLNLASIENQLALGGQTFIYHATNCPCQVYSYDDMLKIIRGYRTHVLYHTTYFNIAKQFIKSLTDLEQINLFSYGTDVSNFTEDSIIKQILKNGEALK